jgi:glycerate kinase
MGIGGSATNDAGFGLARAIGWEFLDRDSHPIERWIDLEDLERIQRPKRRLWTGLLQVAVDVQNPLLGARGATRVYGPQKGLRPRDFDVAERCFRRLAKVVKKQFGHDFAGEPGAGAAGGLGVGLRAFLSARLVPGFDLFARRANLQKHLRWADFVVTGEGSIDDSTFMGKGVGEIARLCRELEIPCLGLGGNVAERAHPHGYFTQVRALTDLATVEQAKARPALWLERLARDCARQITFQIAI